MPFDRAGAKAAGYSDAEIDAYLAQSAPAPPAPAPAGSAASRAITPQDIGVTFQAMHPEVQALLRGVPAMAGMTLGGLAGAPAGPAGVIAGSSLGAGAGQEAMNRLSTLPLVQQLLQMQAQSPGQGVRQQEIMGGLFGAAEPAAALLGRAGGPVAEAVGNNPVLRQAGRELIRDRGPIGAAARIIRSGSPGIEASTGQAANIEALHGGTAASPPPGSAAGRTMVNTPIGRVGSTVTPEAEAAYRASVAEAKRRAHAGPEEFARMIEKDAATLAKADASEAATAKASEAGKHLAELRWAHTGAARKAAMEGEKSIGSAAARVTKKAGGKVAGKIEPAVQTATQEASRHPNRYFSTSQGKHIDIESMHPSHLRSAINKTHREIAALGNKVATVKRAELESLLNELTYRLKQGVKSGAEHTAY